MHVLERETTQRLVDVGFEVEWVEARQVQQPERCVRCGGLLVNDQDAPILWRCINCGCRGEGWLVYGTLTGYATRTERRPQIAGHQRTCNTKYEDYDETEET